MKKKQENNSTKISPELLMKSTKSTNTGEKAESLWNAKDVVAYAEKKLGIKLDEWQKEYIKHVGNTVVRAGRQSGKSFAESLRVALFALINAKTSTLIIASVDRQSIELLEKVKAQIIGLAPKQIKGRPTFHKIELKNGSIIRAEPAGQSGYGLRGFTVDKLVADEAHYIPEGVFVAVQPMLATTGGTIDLLSTPRGNVGFFYDCCQNKEDFHEIHVKSEDCPRITEQFLEQQRKVLTKLQYAQEYEAIFLDALQQFFTLELIKSCIIEGQNAKEGKVFMGADFGGAGTDPSAYVNIINEGDNCFISYVERDDNEKKAWQIIKKMEKLLIKHNYAGIGIDSGGIGSPILDYALKHNKLKRKVVGLNNASKKIDKDGKKSVRILKNDMYWNLKLMMEQGLIKFHENDELVRSLTSIQIEINKETQKEIIWGSDSHITEAAIRAAWLIKTKGLNIMAFC